MIKIIIILYYNDIYSLTIIFFNKNKIDQLKIAKNKFFKVFIIELRWFYINLIVVWQ